MTNFDELVPLFFCESVASRVQIIDLMMKNVCFDNIKNEKKETLLHFFATQGNCRHKGLLFNCFYSTNHQRYDGNTPLHLSLKNPLFFKKLIMNGASLTIENNDNVSVLDMVVIESNISLFEFIMSQRKSDVKNCFKRVLSLSLIHDSSSIIERFLIPEFYRKIMNLVLNETELDLFLLIAKHCCYHSYRVLKDLLMKNNPSLLAEILLNCTNLEFLKKVFRLFSISESNFVSSIDFRKIARVDLRDFFQENYNKSVHNFPGIRAFHESPEYFDAIMEYIVLDDVEESDFSGNSLLYYAIVDNNLHAVQSLLGKEANIYKQCFDGTPIHAAAKYSLESLVYMEFMIKDISIRNEFGETPLIYAFQNSPDAVDKILLMGADPNDIDRFSRNILHLALDSFPFACFYRFAKQFDFLLFVPDNTGRTPAFEALKKYHDLPEINDFIFYLDLSSISVSYLSLFFNEDLPNELFLLIINKAIGVIKNAELHDLWGLMLSTKHNHQLFKILADILFEKFSQTDEIGNGFFHYISKKRLDFNSYELVLSSINNGIFNKILPNNYKDNFLHIAVIYHNVAFINALMKSSYFDKIQDMFNQHNSLDKCPYSLLGYYFNELDNEDLKIMKFLEQNTNLNESDNISLNSNQLKVKDMIHSFSRSTYNFLQDIVFISENNNNLMRDELIPQTILYFRNNLFRAKLFVHMYYPSISLFPFYEIIADFVEPLAEFSKENRNITNKLDEHGIERLKMAYNRPLEHITHIHSTIIDMRFVGGTDHLKSKWESIVKDLNYHIGIDDNRNALNKFSIGYSLSVLKSINTKTDTILTILQGKCTKLQKGLTKRLVLILDPIQIIITNSHVFIGIEKENSLKIISSIVASKVTITIPSLKNMEATVFLNSDTIDMDIHLDHPQMAPYKGLLNWASALPITVLTNTVLN